MAAHSKILHNREIRNLDEGTLSAGQLGLLAGWGVFTTLRVKDGSLFAWERHWARLTRDARLLHIQMPDAATVYRDLHELIRANGRADCTMRLNIVRNGGGMWEGQASSAKPVDVISLTADSKQWGDSARLSITPSARFAANEFTRAKVLSWGANLTLAERALQSGFDETILLNEHGRVAECTSANVFAVFGSEVRTPALSEGCLPGITREVLLEEIRLPGLHLVESSLLPDDLFRADSVFITSTTRDLLRVREIDGRALGSVGRAREVLAEAFRRFVESDIARQSHAASAA